MTAAIRAPQPAPRPPVRLVDPYGLPVHPDRSPAGEPVTSPLRLIPGGREAARRRRRAAAVYRRRRAVAALVLLVCLVGALAGAGSVERAINGAVDRSSTGVSSPSDADPLARSASDGSPGGAHVVAPGDTVWSIARDLQPDGDVRPLVDRLVERSGGSALRVGQRLDLSDLRP